MPPKVANLERTYLIEQALNKYEVDRYASLGKERLIQELRELHPPAEWCESGGRWPVLEVFDGCHRTRALYNLGVRRVPPDVFDIHSASEWGIVGGSSRSVPDAEELDAPEYLRFLRFQLMGGIPFDLRDYTLTQVSLDRLCTAEVGLSGNIVFGYMGMGREALLREITENPPISVSFDYQGDFGVTLIDRGAHISMALYELGEREVRINVSKGGICS